MILHYINDFTLHQIMILCQINNLHQTDDFIIISIILRNFDKLVYQVYF